MTEGELKAFIQQLEDDLFRECCICLSRLRERACSQLVDCNHIYHTSCLMQLLDTMSNANCPMCRKKIVAYHSPVAICSKLLSVKNFIA